MADATLLERELPIINRLGLHARASARLVQAMAPFASQVSLVARGREVNAKSLMGVMMLAVGKGGSVLARVEGPDAGAAMQALADLFARGFDEDLG
jgi:phosphocarrier protein